MAEETPACELEGRELDAAVAREVMGWSEQSDYTQGLGPHTSWVAPDGSMPGMAPRYSEDIDAAWEVVGHLHRWASEDRSEPGLAVRVLQYCDPRCRDNPWRATFYSLDTDDRGRPHDGFAAEAETAPLAICRAALKAVRETT